jgi:hypothetical protein
VGHQPIVASLDEAMVCCVPESHFLDRQGMALPHQAPNVGSGKTK